MYNLDELITWREGIVRTAVSSTQKLDTPTHRAWVTRQRLLLQALKDFKTLSEKGT